MKALSIRQPWAWLILHAGKDIENRGWQDRNPAMHDARLLARESQWGLSTFSKEGGWFLIHTGKGMTRAEYEEAFDFARIVVDPSQDQIQLPALPDLRRGGIVGIARLTKIVFDRHPSPWFFGPVGLVLMDAQPLTFRPLTGALGFFDSPPGYEVSRKDRVWDWVPDTLPPHPERE